MNKIHWASQTRSGPHGLRGKWYVSRCILCVLGSHVDHEEYIKCCVFCMCVTILAILSGICLFLTVSVLFWIVRVIPQLSSILLAFGGCRSVCSVWFSVFFVSRAFTGSVVVVVPSVPDPCLNRCRVWYYGCVELCYEVWMYSSEFSSFYRWFSCL